MKIKDITVGMSNVTVEGKITDVSDTRDVQTRYGPRTVADATLEDDTGEIKLSLWEKQINSVAVGDNVRVVGAYVTKFRDMLQLNIPKSGRLEKV